MATIKLNSQVLNEIPGQIWDSKKKLFNYQVRLFSLENFAQGIDSNERGLSGAINGAIGELRASTDAIEEEIAELEKNQQQIEEFTKFSLEKDNDVASIVIGSKNDFYDMYSYLKPDCEKSLWEDVCEALDSAAEWCKEHWQSIVKVAIAVVVIAALGVATFFTGGALGFIITGAFYGALIGGALGGIIGGIIGATSGGSFFDGFANGILIGTLTGAVTGALIASNQALVGGMISPEYIDLVKTAIKAGSKVLVKEGFQLFKDAKSGEWSGIGTYLGIFMDGAVYFAGCQVMPEISIVLDMLCKSCSTFTENVINNILEDQDKSWSEIAAETLVATALSIPLGALGNYVESNYNIGAAKDMVEAMFKYNPLKKYLILETMDQIISNGVEEAVNAEYISDMLVEKSNAMYESFKDNCNRLAQFQKNMEDYAKAYWLTVLRSRTN